MLLCDKITIELAGNKLFAALCRAVDKENREFLTVHDVHDIHKFTDERGGNRAVLRAVVGHKGKHVLFLEASVSRFLGIVVERPQLDRDAHVGRRVLYHDGRAFRQFVEGALIVGVGVRFDDIHMIDLSAR